MPTPTKEQPTLPDLVKEVLARKNTPWHVEAESGKIIIEGNLDLSDMKLTELPDLSNVVVKGNFICDNNLLTTLKGSPSYVGGFYDCSYNPLTSLDAEHTHVVGEFSCFKTNLTSLKGAPAYVEGDVTCFKSPLMDKLLKRSELEWLKYPHSDPREEQAITTLVLAFSLGGYKHSLEELIQMLGANTAEKKQKFSDILTYFDKAGYSHNTNKYANQIKDFVTAFTTQVIYPLYVLDYAERSGKPVTDDFLRELEKQQPMSEIIKALLPVVQDKVLLQNEQGLRSIDKIVGLSEAWHDPRVMFPDTLRPLFSEGQWPPLTQNKSHSVPNAISGEEGIYLEVLTSSEELKKEGKVMDHCVGEGDYAAQCLDGEYHVVSIRKVGVETPLSTMGVTVDYGNNVTIDQNLSIHNFAPPKAAKKAAEWWVEEIEKGHITLNDTFGETEASKAGKTRPYTIQRVGYEITPENIDAAFREYGHNEKRKAREYNPDTKKFDIISDRVHFITGTYNQKHEPRPVLDKDGNPKFDKRGRPITIGATAIHYADLPATKWFEVSGLRAAIRELPFIPQPKAQEVAEGPFAGKVRQSQAVGNDIIR